jgi:hypothetical protein
MSEKSVRIILIVVLLVATLACGLGDLASREDAGTATTVAQPTKPEVIVETVEVEVTTVETVEVEKEVTLVEQVVVAPEPPSEQAPDDMFFEDYGVYTESAF